MQVFGLGMMLPGGGFLAHASLSSPEGISHFLSAGGALALFLFSLCIWFATGNALFPPLVWVALACSATLMGHGAPRNIASWLLLFGISIGICISLLCTVIWYAWARQKRKSANDLLRKGPSLPAQASLHEEALADESIHRRMAFLLDRALQPLEQFNGFEWLDQFQTAAVRYQINFLGYGLSMAQFSQFPALRGYLDEAQNRLVRKLTDYRVWKYWQLENIWGNLQRNPDPLSRENIMYTGFSLLQMTLHEKAQGRAIYAHQGSFRLQHPSGKSFDHDMHALAASLTRENKRRDFHLVACEPNWIYPLCNTIGAAALKSFSPQAWAQQESIFRERLEQEFIDTTGHFVPCRSAYTGLALPNIGGVMPQAMPCFFLNALLPDIALRHWMVLRARIIKKNKLNKAAFWPIDTGNYRFSRAAAYSSVALTAAELGDEEIRNLCLQALDEEYPLRNTDDFFYRPGASVWAHGVEFMARMTPPGGFGRLVSTPHMPHQEIIETACYNEVIFSCAKNIRGGIAATLHKRQNCRIAHITFGGLLPRARYRIEGIGTETLTANADGKAVWRLTAPGTHHIKLIRSE